ncbi:MAG: Fe-S cluster assembly protein SufD [Mariprofundaceae bacterium]
MSIAAIRKRALDLFEQTPLPTNRNEDWKYTDISRVQDLLAIQSDAAQGIDTEGLAIEHLDAYKAVLVDGVFDDERSDIPESVNILSMAAFLNEMGEQAPDDIQRLFEVRGDESLFNCLMALNAAQASDGVLVCVADGSKLEKPLYIQHISTQTSYVRHAILMGKQAEAEVIEHYVGSADHKALTSLSSQVILKSGAILKHVRLQQESLKQTHIARVEVKQLRDSSYTLHSVELGGALTRVDVVVSLEEAGAFCELNGLFVLNGRQHVDHHTRVDHKSPHCVSRENYRTVLDGRSRAVFNGKVVVHEGAVKTDSSQSNGNLLLSKHACCDTKPELEIYNDDVKCAHGATVGQLDDKQLFYLRSRGVSEEAAKELLTFAFANEVLVGLSQKHVRSYIEKEAFSKLPHGADLDGLLA